MNQCKYCGGEYQNSSRTVLENELFFANFDKHPVNPGHMKLIPKRHIDYFDELSNDELVAMKNLIKDAKRKIDERFHPDGYNIGINEGKAAGQTVFHLHIHIIPRYKGDVSNPIGGIRNIIPLKGDYLKTLNI